MNIFSRFPRTHILIALTIVMPLASIGLFDSGSGRTPVSTPNEMNVVPIPFLGRTSFEEFTDWSRSRSELLTLTVHGSDTGQHPRLSSTIEHVERIRAGDTLASIFDRMSISPRDLAAVLESGPLAKLLQRIHPNRELKFVVTPDKRLVKLSYAPDHLETIEFDRAGDAFTANQVSRVPSNTISYRRASIDQSLFAASQRIGLPDDVTLRLAQIFQWDIDFVLDLRKGDQFSLLLEERSVDGKFIGYGRILAAEFVNQGTRYRAVYYVDADGNGNYYGENGQSLRKAFLRAPVEFSRISSNFSAARFHPIEKRVMPHRGIDYVAPSGTPVFAAGDGRISKATRTEPNGNFIVIDHSGDIETKYLHLSRFASGVAAGSRVHQGQVIGFVGSTGWATAPHLHYEFLVGGVHQDPRTVPLPKADPISRRERERFEAQALPLLAELDAPHDDRQIALAR
jgi:murein DD-endopeptidase MepM/ murein hydrolase activator NlpD